MSIKRIANPLQLNASSVVNHRHGTCGAHVNFQSRLSVMQNLKTVSYYIQCRLQPSTVQRKSAQSERLLGVLTLALVYLILSLSYACVDISFFILHGTGTTSPLRPDVQRAVGWQKSQCGVVSNSCFGFLANDHLPRVSRHSRLFDDNQDGNEVKRGVYRSDIYYMAEEYPRNPHLGNSQKAERPVIASNGIPYLQVTLVELHSTTGSSTAVRCLLARRCPTT